MGWDFGGNKTKMDAIKDYMAGKAFIRSTVVGNVLWTVEVYKGTNIIGCVVLRRQKGLGWGFKDMTEAQHPFYYSCPLSFLDLAPVANEAWRDGVRAFHARREQLRKVKVGDALVFPETFRVRKVRLVKVDKSRWVGEANGRQYGIPPRIREQVVGVEPG